MALTPFSYDPHSSLTPSLPSLTSLPFLLRPSLTPLPPLLRLPCPLLRPYILSYAFRALSYALPFSLMSSLTPLPSYFQGCFGGHQVLQKLLVVPSYLFYTFALLYTQALF